MKRLKISFIPGDKTIAVAAGETILEAARGAGLELESSCGGEGTCGKCRVLVRPSSGGEFEPALACQTRAFVPLEVSLRRKASPEGLPDREATARFGDHDSIAFTPPPFPFDPLAKKIRLRLDPPTLQDNFSDLDRLGRGLRGKGVEDFSVGLNVLRKLPRALRGTKWEASISLTRKEKHAEVIGLEAPGRGRGVFGLAVDAGTTTVVAHLLDLDGGVTLDAEACFNSQIGFGDDIIRRVIHAEEGGGKKLADLMTGDINRLTGILRKRNGIRRDDLLAAVIAGNPAMTALLLRLPADYIRREPYVAPANRPGPFAAAEIGLKINPRGTVHFSPGVAGFVGGDITAGVLAAGLHLRERPALLVDIGTNGEIVLGNRDWLLACSCSAGPAFEGSGISHGTRARAGAIERVDLDDGDGVAYSTIGGERPSGICGSGLLDLLAELFRTGILGRDGRLNAKQGKQRFRETEDGPAFLVAGAEETADGGEIFVTQADIDNLIRAKAAVYAGISVLLKAVDQDREELSGLFVSGGFGSYLNLSRAVRIGMLPPLPEGKTHFIGNGSIRGAGMMLRSRAAMDRADEIARMMTYFELSADNRFMEEFTSAAFLPHTNLELFPSIN